MVPLIKWKALKEDVDTIQKAAEVYENTFNDIITSVKNKENFKQVIQLYQVFLQHFFASIFPLFPPETPDTQASFSTSTYSGLLLPSNVTT